MIRERQENKKASARGTRTQTEKKTTDNSLFTSLTFGCTAEPSICFSLATTRRGAPGGGRKGASRRDGASGGEAKSKSEFLLLLLLFVLLCAADEEGQQLQQKVKNSASAMSGADWRLIVGSERRGGRESFRE